MDKSGILYRRPGERLHGVIETLIMIALVTILALAGAYWLPASAVDLLYLIPVFITASLYGTRPALLAAIGGALAYNFFFTAPLHTLRVSDPGELVTIFVFLGVAVFTARLTGRLRDQAKSATLEAERESAVASFAQALVGARTEQRLASIICAEIARLTRAHVVLAFSDATGVRHLPAEALPNGLVGFDLAAARHTLDHCCDSGRFTSNFQAADWTFHPLQGSTGVVAALGLAREDGSNPLIGAGRLFTTLTSQAVLALERLRLADESFEIVRLRERDRLRGALLSSVGHDLRSPLTSILAAAAELKVRHGTADEMALVIERDAQRLDRYIANLLDMVRVEAGAIRLKLEPIDLIDSIQAAARDLHGEIARDRLSITVPVDLPLLRLDPQLLHHCLINLLLNAARHGGGGRIDVVAEINGDAVILSIADHGPGLPAGAEARLFQTFARLEGSDRHGGSGLGLAIVKGFADVMGVGVEAANRADSPGAIFRMRFPAALHVSNQAEDDQ